MKLHCESKVTFRAIAHTSSAYEATTVFSVERFEFYPKQLRDGRSEYLLLYHIPEK